MKQQKFLWDRTYTRNQGVNRVHKEVKHYLPFKSIFVKRTSIKRFRGTKAKVESKLEFMGPTCRIGKAGTNYSVRINNSK